MKKFRFMEFPTIPVVRALHVPPGQGTKILNALGHRNIDPVPAPQPPHPSPCQKKKKKPKHQKNPKKQKRKITKVGRDRPGFQTVGLRAYEITPRPSVQG